MSIFKIEYTRTAAKELESLPPKEYNRVKKLITALSENPFPHGYLKLEGASNLYRIRQGNYRVIYTVKKKLLQ